MKVNELRVSFLDFFHQRKHKILPSSSLYPSDDPTLLFTNAGMVPFKDYFSGSSSPPAPNLASIQKCLRTKDLEIVGKTKRHLSFFEMLGNFSFNNYFKKEAIKFAWDFSTDILKLDSNKIWITIYDDDDDAESIWKNYIGIHQNKIVRLGRKDNFWGPAGSAGPCGPCSELYLDRGEEIEANSSSKKPGDDTERFLEYWNLVFNQFFKDQNGKYHPLKHCGIDTGAGLERLAAIMQNVDSVFETDELNTLFCFIKDKMNTNKPEIDAPIKIITDHIRSLVFSIADGILPSNESRGYIVRRLLRKAFLQGDQEQYKKPFLFTFVEKVSEIYGVTYPELKTEKDKIIQIIQQEENKFIETLSHGENKLQEILSYSKNIISGKNVFLLYDTYGLPIEVIQEIAHQNSLQVNHLEFQTELSKQKERSKKTWKGSSFELDISSFPETQFQGYTKGNLFSKILGIFYENKQVKSISNIDKNSFQIIVEETCYYPESGGQVSDIGKCFDEDSHAIIFDVQKKGNVIVHYCHHLHGEFKVGNLLNLQIDQNYRKSLEINHSSTHLLNASLRNILGNHVIQQGSLVHSNYLRFDFTHSRAITEEEIFCLESEINYIIEQDIQRNTEIMSIEQAKKQNAIMTFGEKYGKTVRVVSLGNFSKEFCGGTHITRTKEIELFIIIKELSSSSGVRRIEARTNNKAKEYIIDVKDNLINKIDFFLQKNTTEFKKLEELKIEIKNLFLNTISYDVWCKLNSIQDVFFKLENHIKKQSKKKNNIHISNEEIDLILQTKEQNSILAYFVPNKDIHYLKEMADKLREKRNNLIFCLQTRQDDQWAMVFATSKTYSQKRKIHLGKIIKSKINSSFFLKGGGGGRDEIAQASAIVQNGIEDQIIFSTITKSLENEL